MKKTDVILSPKKSKIEQNTKISSFFKSANGDVSAECSDTENIFGNTEASKKRTYSSCQNANDSTNIANKTPTESALVFTKTPSPSKSPLQKKQKSCMKTPVKNLFKQHVADIDSFNVGILERFIKQSPEKIVAGNLVAELESCKLTNTNSFGLEENINAFFEEDSWDCNSFSELDSALTLDLSTSRHCKVLQVNELDNKKVLLLESTKTGEKCWCSLLHFWKDLPVTVGNLLHVKAKSNLSAWIVSNDCGVVVFEPDYLVSSTSVVASLFCKRRTVISERYRTYDPKNKYVVLGSIIHRLLQNCLKARDSEMLQIENQLKDLLKDKDTVNMLYAASLKIEDLGEQLKEYTPQIEAFIKQYIEGSCAALKPENWKGKIDAIQDIEENFWCPELGVKGKVDVSVQVKNQTMPVELKTGKSSMSLEHRGQVMLYVLMMQKFGYDVNSGLLFYLKDCTLKEIKPSDIEIRDLVILRNELVYYLAKVVENAETSFNKSTENGLFPKPINHHSACKTCPCNIVCCTYLKTEDYDLTNYNHLKSVQGEVLGHLSEDHLKYFIHWSSLLTLEGKNRSNLKNFREVFTVDATTREKSGKCLCNLTINEVEECGSQYLISFTKSSEENKNFMTSGIAENSYVVISTNTRPATATGFVTNVDHKTITVAADRDLKTKYPKHLFHVDTYDSDSVTVFNMANLALLLEPTEQSERLRKFIIEKQKPTFLSKLPKAVATKASAILQRLNRVQQRAVLKAVSANDYILITGMPGTGKTSTIVALIQLLVELKQSVIITSHTHSAVDNVCLRLMKYGVQDILRLGDSSKIHRNLADKAEREVTKNCKTPEELEKCYNAAKVTAVTCLGSGHPLLSKRIFDVCIVDESTQVLQPSVIRVLLSSKKFVLVGDPKQLSPVVRSCETSSKGMSESLFERLQHSESNVVLNLNYRMNKEITRLANDFTYKGELLTATDEVANSHLTLPKLETLTLYTAKYPWLKEIFDESLNKSVMVLNTGKTVDLNTDLLNLKNNSTETVEAQYCSNAAESVLVTFLVQVLLQSGIPNDFIGVIAPYRAQVAQLSSLLENTGVDVNTADRFQGKDKEVIVLSCTKSYDRVQYVNRNYEILEDEKRLNVIVTRAKQKIIIVGDVDCIKTYKSFQRLLDCIGRDCFLDVCITNDDLSNLFNCLKLQKEGTC